MFIGPSIMIKLLWALYTELWIKYIIPALSGLGSMLCLSILHSQALWWTTEHLTEKSNLYGKDISIHTDRVGWWLQEANEDEEDWGFKFH